MASFKLLCLKPYGPAFTGQPVWYLVLDCVLLQRLHSLFQQTCGPEREKEELIQKEELKFKGKEVV